MSGGCKKMDYEKPSLLKILLCTRLFDLNYFSEKTIDQSLVARPCFQESWLRWILWLTQIWWRPKSGSYASLMEGYRIWLFKRHFRREKNEKLSHWLCSRSMKREARSLHTLKSIQSIRTGETRTSFRSFSPYRWTMLFILTCCSI